MKTTRHNHVPSNYVIRSIETRNEDLEVVFSYPKYDAVPLEDILKSADEWVINGHSPVVSVIEIEEQVCLECSEICVRAERELVVFQISPEDAQVKTFDYIEKTLGKDSFRRYLEENPTAKENFLKVGGIL